MIHTTTIAGTNAAVQLTTASNGAIWVDIYNGAAANNILVGDGSTSSTIGRPVVKATSFLLPPKWQDAYDLNQIYAYIQTSDVVTVTWEGLE